MQESKMQLFKSLVEAGHSMLIDGHFIYDPSYLMGHPGSLLRDLDDDLLVDFDISDDASDITISDDGIWNVEGYDIEFFNVRPVISHPVKCNSYECISISVSSDVYEALDTSFDLYSSNAHDSLILDATCWNPDEVMELGLPAILGLSAETIAGKLVSVYI